MKRHIFLILILLICWNGRCFAQLDDEQLMQVVTLVTKDVLDLRLQILAAQMSCGSFYVPDMGTVEFPVAIKIDDSLRIVFELRDDPKSKISLELKKSFVEQSMSKVDLGIGELLEKYFPRIKFDHNQDLIGYWYFAESPPFEPASKWEKGKLIWLK